MTTYAPQVIRSRLVEMTGGDFELAKKIEDLFRQAYWSATVTGKLGFATGAGATVTQATSRTTGVTVNGTSGAPTGTITLVSAAGSAAYQSFVVTNAAVEANDLVICHQISGTDKYEVMVTNVVAGAFTVTFATTGGVTVEQPVFRFMVLKSVNA